MGRPAGTITKGNADVATKATLRRVCRARYLEWFGEPWDAERATFVLQPMTRGLHDDGGRASLANRREAERIGEARAAILESLARLKTAARSFERAVDGALEEWPDDGRHEESADALGLPAFLELRDRLREALAVAPGGSPPRVSSRAQVVRRIAFALPPGFDAAGIDPRHLAVISALLGIHGTFDGKRTVGALLRSESSAYGKLLKRGHRREG